VSQQEVHVNYNTALQNYTATCYGLEGSVMESRFERVF